MPFPLIDLETAEPQALAEIRDWHRGIIEALIDQRASVLRAIRAGAAISPRFVGMTESNVDAYHEVQRRELNRLTMLNLVASAEATIKIDYFRRVGKKGRKLKDPLTVAYREWHKKLPNKEKLRPAFDGDGILKMLKAHVSDSHVVGRYRECLRARHWVGHGRYWAKPVEVDQLDPDDVFDRADALLRSIPA